jgi:hypothetical protein
MAGKGLFALWLVTLAAAVGAGYHFFLRDQGADGGGPEAVEVSWPPRFGRHDTVATVIPQNARPLINMAVSTENATQVLGADGRFWPREGDYSGTCTTSAGELKKTAKVTDFGFLWEDESKSKKVGWAYVVTEGELLVPVELFRKPPTRAYVENSYECEDFGDKYILVRLDPAKGHRLHIVDRGQGYWVTAGFVGTTAHVAGAALKRRQDGWYHGGRKAGD